MTYIVGDKIAVVQGTGHKIGIKHSDLTSGSIIIAGAKDRDGITSRLCKSADSGESFGYIYNPLPRLVDLYKLGNGKMLASSSLGISLTTNYGDYWSVKSVPFRGGNFQTFEDGTIITPGRDENGRLSKSVDGGYTWTSLGEDLVPGSDHTSCVSHCVSYLGDGVCVAGVGRSGGPAATDAAVYKSTDYGATWTFQAKLSGGMGYIYPFRTCYLGNNIILMSTASETAYSVYGVYRSTDGGSTWSGGIVYDPGAFYLNMGDGVVYSGGRYALYRSDNYGETWNNIFSISTGVSSMTQIGDSSTFLIGTTEGGHIYKSTDNCSTWRITQNLLNVKDYCEQVLCLSELT